MSPLTHHAEVAAPHWMRITLLLAAAYNIVWGAAVIFAPVTTMRWGGFVEPMPYPQMWQCIGMIVGVYGIGYAIAAGNPYRHWPIVLVGLLGKIFGPIGMLAAIIDGTLPASAARTILTNDLIWWAPFCIILWQSWKWNQPHAASLSETELGDPLRTLKSQSGTTLDALSHIRPTLVVFLRHSGCTFCREALADLAAKRTQLESQGVGLALVHLGDDEAMQVLCEQYGLSDLPRFCDPERRLYQAFRLKLGSFMSLIGPKVLWRGMRAAFASRHGIGRFDGNVFQLPGAFLIDSGQIVREYRHATAADRPDYVALACPIATGHESPVAVATRD
jgi:hypothetical protein